MFTNVCPFVRSKNKMSSYIEVSQRLSFKKKTCKVGKQSSSGNKHVSASSALCSKTVQELSNSLLTNRPNLFYVWFAAGETSSKIFMLIAKPLVGVNLPLSSTKKNRTFLHNPLLSSETMVFFFWSWEDYQIRVLKSFIFEKVLQITTNIFWGNL